MKEKDIHNELIELATKKLANEASNEELIRLSALLAEEPSNQSIYDQHVRAWELTVKAKGISDLEIQQEWDRLDHAIDQLETSKEPLSLFRIAAAVALILTSSFLAYQHLPYFNTTEIVAEALTEKQLVDGTKVTLGAHAQLRYSNDFNQDQRKVELSGQAFFDVTKDAKRPFVIQAGNTTIQVLGTSFNVKAKKLSPITEVVVVSGKVQVTHTSGRITLLPGEKAVVNKKSGKLFKIQNDDPNFLSWRTKNFTFSDLPLSDVVVLLTEVYHQPITLENAGLETCPVTVTFQDQNLETILEILANTLDLKIEKTDRTFVISGEGCE